MSYNLYCATLYLDYTKGVGIPPKCLADICKYSYTNYPAIFEDEYNLITTPVEISLIPYG